MACIVLLELPVSAEVSTLLRVCVDLASVVQAQTFAEASVVVMSRERGTACPCSIMLLFTEFGSELRPGGPGDRLTGFRWGDAVR
mmetsp:Transcript_128702/g.223198  ORF Transcript_128702/g.223198 Transcript_128702/m.223198 type:complete len:85 (+) Transcript_128702:808-1062(+)